MSSRAFVERLSRALESTGLAQTVNMTHSDNQVRVLMRVLKDCDSQWIKLVHNLLLAAKYEEGRPHSWQSHICRSYFLKDVNGDLRLVYGWNITIQAQDIRAALDRLIPIIKGETPGARSNFQRAEVEEIELTGVVGDRNVPKYPGDKGAFTVGSKKGTDFRPSFGGNSGVTSR